MSKGIKTSRSVTATDVWQRDRGVVPGNLLTLILGQTLPMFTTWANTDAPPAGDMEKEEVHGQNT